MAERTVNLYRGVFKRAEELYNEEKYRDAAPLFKQIIENDPENFVACYYYAECLYYGRGVAKDVKQAFKMFMTAAANKITDAAYMVGLCYLEGAGVNQDSTQAVAWFTEAAKYAHPLSQYYLGLAYMNGDGISKDIPRAAQWLVHAAKQGVVEAARDAAICYEALGKFKGAATLYLSAAENGDAYSQEKIADFYADGIGTLQCTELAIHYYELAAGQGNVEAQVKMGNRYATGKGGVEQSIKHALQWWMKAANAGNAEAQNNVGECYYSGEGVYQDYSVAMSWWTKAAEQGNVNAMVHLAETNAIPPDGEQPDMIQSKYWWMKAAEKKDPYSMYRLAECFEKGWGVPVVNLEDAYKWYKAAVQEGYEEANEDLKRFSKSITGKIKIKKK